MNDNILDFSKIEAGRKKYAFADGDMADVIEDVLSSYRYQIINSGFDIQTNIQPDLPPVLIDRDAMAQAISNLLDNAIKYSREVKRLSITTERRESDLSIEIADHGIGIPRYPRPWSWQAHRTAGPGLRRATRPKRGAAVPEPQRSGPPANLRQSASLRRAPMSRENSGKCTT